MTVDRRRILQLAAAAALLPASLRRARAQAYPGRPVRWVVGYAAAGATDILARLMGQWLSDRLGQPFIVENRPGAASNVATEAVVRSAPDGYTLLMASAANAISATLYDRLPYDFIRDIAPIAGIARVANVMLAHPSLPAASVPELIAYAKANPGRISMASAGIGSPQHLAGELFKMMAGVDMLHVPYRGGGPALTDLLGGQVQVSFSTTVSSAGYIKAGKLRALAVTTAVRSEALPDVPVMADFVPGYEASTWYGIAAPKGTAPEVIGLLNTEANAALADARFKARLADLGGTGLAGSPADFAGLIAEETEKWGRVVKFAGAKA
jgi:tripartite-type tricarboxylate transporter receptor subunit TctC